MAASVGSCATRPRMPVPAVRRERDPPRAAAVPRRARRGHATLLLRTGTRNEDMVVIERTRTRARVGTAESGIVVATNDYRAMETVSTAAIGELADTACDRYDRALHRALRETPDTSRGRFGHLERSWLPRTVRSLPIAAGDAHPVVPDPQRVSPRRNARDPKAARRMAISTPRRSASGRMRSPTFEAHSVTSTSSRRGSDRRP